MNHSGTKYILVYLSIRDSREKKRLKNYNTKEFANIVGINIDGEHTFKKSTLQKQNMWILEIEDPNCTIFIM